MAWLSLSASVDTADKKGYFAISINGVDSRVIAYHFTDADYKDSVGIVFRTTSTLPAGTYSVKARWYTQNGVALSGENISLTVMAMETVAGNPIPSTYKDVASDSTSSTTFEDIDGSSDNITLNSDSHVASFLTGAISSFNDNANITTGINIDGESTSNELLYENAVKEGINIVVRTITELTEGSNNIKGEWLTDPGNIATGDPILLGSIGLESGENYSIPSMRDFVSNDSTTSDSIEDIDGLSDTVVLTDESHIFAAMTMTSYSESAEKSGIYYININGTDYPAITKKFKNADDRGSVVVYARTDTRLPAGTYTVKGRWETDNGNTLYGEDISLIALAAETEFTASSSNSSYSSESSSLSSDSSSSSESSNISTSSSSIYSESSSSESDSSSMSMQIERTYRTSIPDAGITLYGIVDVISDKSIVVQKTVGPTGNVLKGEVVVIDGAGKVKTSASGAKLGTEVCGIAISSGIPGMKVSILRSGKARIVYSDPANIEIGAPVKCADDGMVVYSDDSNLTIGRVLEFSMFVSFLGKGYLDIELDLLGAKI
jgi:hypothetical protein